MGLKTTTVRASKQGGISDMHRYPAPRRAILVLLAVACGKDEQVQAQLAQARAEAEAARAEAEKARAEAEKVRTEAERARTESASVQAGTAVAPAPAASGVAAARVARGTKRAPDSEVSDWIPRAVATDDDAEYARQEALRLLTAEVLGCQCGPGRQIAVTCRVRNGSAIPIEVSVDAVARPERSAYERGVLGDRPSSGSQKFGVMAPGQVRTELIVTHYDDGADCSACSGPSCKPLGVLP
jgi:hypothetical protein